MATATTTKRKTTPPTNVFEPGTKEWLEFEQERVKRKYGRNMTAEELQNRLAWTRQFFDSAEYFRSLHKATHTTGGGAPPEQQLQPHLTPILHVFRRSAEGELTKTASVPFSADAVKSALHGSQNPTRKPSPLSAQQQQQQRQSSPLHATTSSHPPSKPPTASSSHSSSSSSSLSRMETPIQQESPAEPQRDSMTGFLEHPKGTNPRPVLFVFDRNGESVGMVVGQHTSATPSTPSTTHPPSPLAEADLHAVAKAADVEYRSKHGTLPTCGDMVRNNVAAKVKPTRFDSANWAMELAGILPHNF
ncbi:hypothetical protein Pelo_5287 [Pelomyxa schiedti]|nr:hypothetical protein Pelo_5287 [Pelomyxa schiedti]